MATRGSKVMKNLLVFDFDHSLIDGNSDLHVRKLAPGGHLPDRIKKLYSKNGWTPYMAEIFKYLHENGTTKREILDCMSEIPLINGMDALLEHTSQGGQFDHIVISDSNSVFIQHILEYRNVASVFHRIFTNPAEFLDNGLLTLKGYHQQDWCTLSSVNMCKGHILETFIQDRKKESVEYSHVLYVGDGHNDLCPALRLSANDFILPRLNFTLNKMINDVLANDEPVPKSSLKAKVVPWRSGLDILQCIKSYVDLDKLEQHL